MKETSPAAASEQLRSGAAMLERRDAGVLLLEDADRVDFLQRMTTNDIAALRAGGAAVTIFTSPTAKILFVFTVLCRDNDLVLLPTAGETSGLERHLRGQIFFMDKVRVRDVSEQWKRLRVVGPHAASVVDRMLGQQPPADNCWVESEGVVALGQQAYGLPGIELLVPDHALDEVRRSLSQHGAAVVEDAGALLARRIELGRPAPGAELTADANPLEAGMGWACAENKGCYTGQEILARQVTYDKVTRTLVGVRSPHPLQPGERLTTEGREVGVITSAAPDPRGEGGLALAIVRRPHNVAGQVLQAGGQAVALSALPFVRE